MAHVQIHQNSDGSGRVLVDGVDLSMHILADGFRIENLGGGKTDPARVHMTVVADTLDVDLPEAVIEAVRQDGDAA